MKRNILILSAGRRVKLLEGFKSAAQRIAPGARVLAADLNPKLSAACDAADDSFALPHVLSAEYIPALRALCADQDIGLVVPTIDTELKVLAAAREAFAEQDTHIMVSELPLIMDCADKRATRGLFDRLGVPSPRIFDRSRITFPCFTKPAFGSSSIGAMTLGSAPDLTEGLLAEPDRIFMELIPPDYDEVTVDLYYDRDSILRCAVPRYRIETRAGEVSKGVTRRGRVYDTVLKQMADLPGARGCMTLQLFIPADDRPILAIEINARFGGGFPLSLAAGADFPGWMISEWLYGNDVAFFDSWERDLLMLRYDDHRLVPAFV